MIGKLIGRVDIAGDFFGTNEVTHQVAEVLKVLIMLYFNSSGSAVPFIGQIVLTLDLLRIY